MVCVGLFIVLLCKDISFEVHCTHIRCSYKVSLCNLHGVSYSVKQENLLQANCQRRRSRKMQNMDRSRECCEYSWQQCINEHGIDGLAELETRDSVHVT